MEHLTSSTLISGFGYLEAPRWRDGKLWVSDLQSRCVHTITLDARAEKVFESPETPIGLGFSNGSLRVVASDTRKLLTVVDGAVEDRVDLRDLAVVAANDMAIAPGGQAYVSHFGYDLFGGDAPEPTGLIMVAPDGTARLTGGGLIFPNGVAVDASGTTLVVAESFAYRLTAFDIAPDGELTNGRTFVQFESEQEMVDGICIDREGAVWVGMPFLSEFRRVVEGGAVTHVVRPERESFTVACALGGDDLRTLFMTVADTTLELLADNWGGEARVETVRVDTPGIA